MRIYRAALLLFLAAGPGVAADTVTWMTEDLPPEFIYHGPLEEQGVGDQAIRFLADNLPAFRHHVVRAGTARIFYEMAHKDGICYWGAWRTAERKAFAVFSNRPVPGPSFRIVVGDETLAGLTPYLNAKGEIDLGALATGDRLTGGYVASQPYPGVIGGFIGNPERKVRLEQVTQVAQLYSLLNAGRVDFIIGNGVETTYYLSQDDGKRKFHALLIRNGPPSTVGYVACSKGPIGSSVIAGIDRLLSDDSVWARYLAPMRRWGDPADFAAALASRPEKP